MQTNASLLPPEQFTLNRRLWWAIAALTALDLAWLASAGLTLDFSHARIFFYVMAGCAALSFFYHYIRRDDTLRLLGHITGQLICATVALGVLSYVTARLALPLTDARLIAFDQALGFDWLSYLHWVDAHPWLGDLLTFAYFSSGPQIMPIIAALFLTRQSTHIQRFIIAFIAAALVTIVFAALFPAVGGYVYYNIDVHTLHHLHPAASRVHEAPLMAMRAGPLAALVFPLEGIITFPSFHCALSILLIYASLPVRWLRPITIPLNILVIFATPTDGGHYLADILGGIPIGLAAAVLAQRIYPRLPD